MAKNDIEKRDLVQIINQCNGKLTQGDRYKDMQIHILKSRHGRILPFFKKSLTEVFGRK